DEDAAGASFAGQHDTYLNVRGEDAVLEAVARCRDSAISPGALAYRKQQGISVEDVKIGILVQQLVASDVSAIIFSHNPINKSPDELVINASWGLGESLVGGTVTPDTYVIRKSDLSVVSRQIAKKEQMTVMVPDGTKEVPVPKLLSEEPTLNDEQAIEMAQMAIKLEKATAYPVDIECAVAQGTLYLLQCRPITTL
ncbi:MAG: PEP/pyruvate-binding domain-containing protein, partial [Chloroflexi bacterium]|nr:PEP/pyruvate-binding domain-containing protein [Chloroflexota bacterium]